MNLDSIEGVYVVDGKLWIHDGQWKGELIDFATGESLESLIMSPTWELLRKIMSEGALRWRLQMEPIVIGPTLLLSVTNGVVRNETGEFGLLQTSDWLSVTPPTFEPLVFRSVSDQTPYARGVHQGTFLTSEGHLALLTAQHLYDMETQDSGPYLFSFFVVDGGARAFDLVEQVKIEGANMGMAYRELVLPAGWEPREFEQPICYDWSPERSLWTYRGAVIEVMRDESGRFGIRVGQDQPGLDQ